MSSLAVLGEQVAKIASACCWLRFCAWFRCLKHTTVTPTMGGGVYGYLRIVDESGEDYAYARERFFLSDLSSAVEEALLAATAGLAT